MTNLLYEGNLISEVLYEHYRQGKTGSRSSECQAERRNVGAYLLCLRQDGTGRTREQTLVVLCRENFRPLYLRKEVISLNIPSVEVLKKAFPKIKKEALAAFRDEIKGLDFLGILRRSESLIGANGPHGRNPTKTGGRTLLKFSPRKPTKNTLELVYKGEPGNRTVSAVRITTYREWIKKNGPPVA